MEADTDWMRRCADDCDSTATAIRKLLSDVDDAVAELKAVAAGWEFPGSQDEMVQRWEDLNELLRDELSDAAENLRFDASSHDGNENVITETWHNIFG